MRLLYSFPHPVGRPGIGTTALHQVRSLARAGADVTLVCTSLHAEVPEDVRVIETLRVRGRRIPHRVFGSPDRALAYHDRRAARLLAADPPEVVHVWPGSAMASIGRARTLGSLSSREVPNTHTANAYEVAAREAAFVGVEARKGHSHRPDARRLALEEREYASADLLMVPSEPVARSFLERGFPEERLGRHQYGYDPEVFHSRGRADSPDRPFTAVVVGSAEPRKGLHHALDAWRRAALPPGSRLLVAGGFVSGYGERLRDGLALPGVEPLGFVDDVASLFRRSDVLVMPSVEEGSALVTYEAQASGCVPLASTAAGAHLPPAVERWTHQPGDVETLASQLRAVATDTDLLHELRASVVDWSAGLTWDVAGRRMLDIYDEHLSRARRAG